MTTSRPATRTRVKVQGSVRAELHALAVHSSCGGKRLDYATIEQFAVPRGTKSFADQTLADIDQQDCVVEAELYDGEWHAVHFGRLVAQRLATSARGESLIFTSRLEPFHFGGPLLGEYSLISTAKGDDTGVVRNPVVFNPEYEGLILPNYLPLGNLHLIAPPESLGNESLQSFLKKRRAGNPGNEDLRKAQVKSSGGQDVFYFNLRFAALYLLQQCNPLQAFVKNPSFREIVDVLPEDPRILRAHKQPLGKYLPDQLDALLHPYGFGWYVLHASDQERKIQIFARGIDAAPYEAGLQAAGSTIDLARSNAEEIDLAADLTSRMTNRVRVLGAYPEVEVTIELVPAWSETWDNIEQIERLARYNEDEWRDVPELARVWRDWVFNEAGDYDKTRNKLPDNGKKLATLLGVCQVKRRRLEPTITLARDGSPIGQTSGVTVEWWQNNDATWRPLDELSAEGRTVKLLRHELGIRFDGVEPPWEIMAQGKNAKVRVTATIAGDQRLEQLVDFTNQSPLTAPLEEVFDVPSKFKLRQIDSSSIYADQVQAGTLAASTEDDRDSALLFAGEILENWNQASIHGQVTITGCGWPVARGLGRTLGQIFGRGINLRTNHQATKTPRHPSIAGIELDFQNQTTTLVLDTYRTDPLR